MRVAAELAAFAGSAGALVVYAGAGGTAAAVGGGVFAPPGSPLRRRYWFSMISMQPPRFWRPAPAALAEIETVRPGLDPDTTSTLS